MTIKDKRKYELMVILDPEITEKEKLDILSSIRKEIEEEGDIFGEVIWGLKELAYSIKKKESGFYAIWHFNFNTAALKELDKSLRLNRGILRHLLMTIDDKHNLKDYQDLSELIKKDTRKPVKDEDKIKDIMEGDNTVKKNTKKVKIENKKEKDDTSEPKKEEQKEESSVDEKLEKILGGSDIKL